MIMDFRVIYDFAIKGDTEGLQALLDTGVCIDVRAPNGINAAVSLLAQEGNSSAVTFLLANGASVHLAAFGFALGGYHDLVDDLVSNKGAALTSVVFGSALGGHFSRVDELIKNKGADVGRAVQGYALAGHFDHVDELVNNKGADSAIQGYALAGYFAKVDELIDTAHSSLASAVFGYARGGYVTQVDELIGKGANVNIALEGYAFGGHFSEVNELIKTNGADISHALRGYARAGHLPQVNDLIARGANVDFAIAGYRIDPLLTPKSLPRLWAAADSPALKKAIYLSMVHSSMQVLWNNLGYSTIHGCCHGFSLKWLEACFLGEEALLDTRVKKIVLGSGELMDKIQQVKEKKGKNLTKEDHELLDILAFYDGLALYHVPHRYTDLFKASYNQGAVEHISHFAASDKMIDRGGLEEIYSEPVIYTELEIKDYLDKLGAILALTDGLAQEPIGILFSSSTHAIATTYVPGVGWQLMDINQYPSESFCLEDTLTIAKKLVAGFKQVTGFKQHVKSPYIAFNVSLITAGLDPRRPQLKEQFDLFKKSHVLSKDMACRRGGVGLAWIAASYGHANVIAELKENGADLNEVNDDGMTPTYVAAQNGHVHVLIELKKGGAYLNKANNIGLTPAYIAARQGHADVIVALKMGGADLNKASNEGETPAFTAADQGHAHVIAALIMGGADLNKADNMGLTPVWIAAHNGHLEVVRYLLSVHNIQLKAVISTVYQFVKLVSDRDEGVKKRMEAFLQSKLDAGEPENKISVMPQEIAAVMGNLDIVEEFSKIDPVASTSVNQTNAYVDSTTSYKKVLEEIKEPNSPEYSEAGGKIKPISF
jgi:ankyrin repeat protein